MEIKVRVLLWVARALVAISSAVGITTIALLFGAIFQLYTKAQLVERLYAGSFSTTTLVVAVTLFILITLIHRLLYALEDRAVFQQLQL